MDNAELLNAALGYAAAGLKVFPLAAGGKKPLTGHGFKEATTDLEQVRRWWSEHPNANIGIACGSCGTGAVCGTGCLTVVDLDNKPEKNVNGFATLYEWQKENGVLPATLTAKTGGGGYHYYFISDEPFRNGANILGENSGVDIRSEGGYVVAPPSIHKSGARYEWDGGFDVARIATGGAVLNKLCEKKSPERQVRPDCPPITPVYSSGQSGAADLSRATSGRSVPLAMGAPSDRTDSIIQRMGLSFAEGSRNDSLFRLAASLQAQGYQDSTIFDIVAKANNERCAAPLGDKELDTIIRSAVDRYSKGIPKTVEATGGDIELYTEKLAEKFPYIIPHEQKDGTITYSVSTPLLAEYVRDHDRYFFLDTGGEKPPAFWYEGGYYSKVDDNTFKGRIRRHIEDFDKLLVSSRILDEVFKLLLMDGKRVKPSELDSADSLICFRNGILNVDTLTLVPHSPELYCTIQIPCDWNGAGRASPAGESPVFDRYLHTLTSGNEDFKRLLWEFTGFTISNMNGYEPKKALFLYGPGDTGKSVFLDLLSKLVGADNFASTDLKELEERFGTMALWRKRLAGCPDMSYMNVDELSVFKKLTGGDDISFEQKGKDRFTDKFRGVLMFCANRLPKFGGDKGDHVYSRMILCPCNNVIPPEQRDRRLREKIFAEREGIVFKAVMALRDFRARGCDFIIPDICRLASEEYKVENDGVLQFLDECTERREELEAHRCIWRTSTADIYKAFRAWSMNNGGYTPSNQDFRRVLCEKFGVNKPLLLERKARGHRFYAEFDLTESARRELLGF